MRRNGKVLSYPNTEEAKRQVVLATHNACQLAKNFTDQNISVTIDANLS